jgi:pimeloyl-ACP methyl ester carboxylesterase
VNRYAYCDNNPVNGIDPMGLYTLIVHGLGEHSEGYSGELGKKLRSSGETTNEIFWSGNILDIAAFSRVANEIKGAADFAAARGEQLNVIGHSWGGVLVSSALRTTKSKANLATLGTPYFNLSRPVGVRRYVNFIGEGDIIGLMSIFNVSAMQFGVINGRTDIANIHNYWNNEEVINIILEMSNADRGRRDGKSATK